MREALLITSNKPGSLRCNEEREGFVMVKKLEETGKTNKGHDPHAKKTQVAADVYANPFF